MSNNGLNQTFRTFLYKVKSCSRVVELIFCDILNPWADSDNYRNEGYEPMLSQENKETDEVVSQEEEKVYCPPIIMNNQPNEENLDEAAKVITNDSEMEQIISQNNFNMIFKEKINSDPNSSLPTINEDLEEII